MIRFSAVLFLLLTVTAPIAGAESVLKLYDSTVSFRHFAYVLNSDGTLKKFDRYRTVIDRYAAKVMENDLIKVTLVPDFGARILSIIYKPTGQELLYQNPIGTVFNWKKNTFYYNYLVVWGGIFPTFPEPEHGKAWQLPWEHKIAEMDDEHISYEMKFTDNIDNAKKAPAQFRYRKTWLTCIVTVTVRRGSSAVEMNVRLVNNRPEYILYEYWTCMTLAPGSKPGKPAATGNTELVIPTDLVTLKNSWWPWMDSGNQGKWVQEGVFTYNRLSYYSNWQDMGIAYVYPYVTNSWYGVLNHSNNTGVFRVTKNTNDTPGLKLWTWGCRQGLNGNPKDSGDERRPYIELWAGNSTEFFTPAKMSPMQKKNWSEFYIPTVGLTNITFANENAAVYLSRIKNPDGETSVLSSEIFSLRPSEEWKAVFQLSNKNGLQTLSSENMTGNPTNAVRLQMTVSNSLLAKGVNHFLFLISGPENSEIASATVLVTNN